MKKLLSIIFCFAISLCFSQIKPDFKNSFFYLGNSIIGISKKENLFVQSGQNLWKIDLNKGNIDLHLKTDSNIGSFDFTKKEKYIVNENSDDIIIWKNGKKYKQWEIPKGIYRIRTNKTNFDFALADIQSNKIQIWNAQKGKLVKELKTEYGNVQTLYYTENGKYLIIGTEECEVIIYDNITKSIKQRFLLNDCEKAKGIVSISSDLENNKILFGIRHSETRLIDFNTGKLINRYKSYGASTLSFNTNNSYFYEGTGIASINNLYVTDIKTGVSKKIKDDHSFMHYRNITIPINKKYWLVAGNGIMFLDKENNNILLEIFFHRDKNKENRDLWWNAINFATKKVGGSDTKYLLKNKNEISKEDKVFDKRLFFNFIKSYN